MEKVLKYTEKEVNFDSVKIPQILYEHGPLGRKGKIEYNDDEVTYIDDKPFINAVDIDWNGIEVENNNRINTTADLINWIKNKTSNTSNIELEEISVPATCYRWYNINATPIIPILNIKNPQSEDNEAAFPEYNWSEYAINRPEGLDWVLYLCSGTKTISTNTYSWESITRISGIDGSAGEDSNEREWIYKTFTQLQTFSSNNNNPSYWNISQQSDYLGPNGYLWSDNPQGVSIENKFEYTSYRDYKNGSWTKFSQPILWSHYGVNGIDGDGVEYCYVRTKSKSTPEVLDNGNHYEDEYLPIVRIETLANYNNSDGPDIIGKDDTYFQNGYSYAKCTDNPVGVDDIYLYEWVITRTKQGPDEEGKRLWNNYSGKMSLWSSWTVMSDSKLTIKDGYWWCNGDYIRDGNGNPIPAEGGDGSLGVEVVNFCPGENEDYPIGTIAYCKTTGYTSIKTGDNTWYNLGETSGTGNILHIAYALDINFTTRSFTGFSKTNNLLTAYPWIGFLVNDKKLDPDVGKESLENSPENDPIWNAFMEYKWNYVRGRDGNGVEYVFLLTKEEVTNPGIDENTYEDNKGVHNKQDDEFLPQVTNYDLLKHQSSTWTDDPQQSVSENWPKLWKAIRKKVNGVWQSFRPPKIENQYFAQTSAYIITSDNDTIVLDDLSTSDNDLESASSGTLTLIYNNTPVIKDNNNNLTWVINSKYDIFLPYSGLTVDLNKNTGAFKVKYNREDVNTTVQSNFVEGLYYFIVSAKINDSIVAQKKIAFIVKNISIDGSFYRLVILNDSQSYKSDGTPNNNSNPIISVHKIKDGKSEQITEDIKLINDTTNLSEGSGITLVIPNGLEGTYVDGNSTVSIDYSNPNKLPITLENVDYEQGGYDIALYYDEELLDAEHIDCVKDGKDGKDASISDGITIDHIDRYYQATNTNNTYPNSHEGHENENDGADGWWGMQSDAGWSASNPYLFIQDHTFYNNDTNSWGKVELYSYWGNKNYDLVVSPQHIILDENVDKENGDRSYSGTNTVTVTLYKSGKSGTENSITPTILQCKFYFIKDSNPYNLTQIERNINTKTTTITINTNKSNDSSMYSIEEYLSDKDNSISEGYLSFTVVGYENGKLIFTREVKVLVYINRAESKLFGVKGELKSYIEDQGYITETTYTADISATQKTLRSEYTEKIKYAKDRGKNLFGFNKGIYWHQDTTLSPVIPFIQGYGIVVKNSGAISNIGIEKLTEDTETESFGNYTVSFSAKTNENKGGSYYFLFCGRNAETVTVNKSTQSNPENPITIYDNKWVDITLSFNLNDISDEKLYGLGFMRKTYDSYAYLYVRYLKIELGSVATDFCEADEDIMNLGKNQMITALTNNGMTEGTFEVETDNLQKGYSKSVNTGLLSPYVDLLNQDNAFSLQAGKTYTLSFWAKCSTAGMIIKSYLHGSSIITISSDVEIFDGDEIFEGVQTDGETKVHLFSVWKHYFIRLYVGNTVSRQSLIALRVSKNDNLISGSTYRSGTIYMAGIVLQEGYVMDNERFSSLIEQNARRISMYQTTGLTKAGIDIYNGKVNVLADNFTITNNNGDVNMSVNETGDVEFRGVIKGTYNFKVQIYNNSGSDTIRSDTDYYMFNGSSSSGQSAKMPNPMDCPGRVINISKNNRPTQNGVLLQNYDSEIPFIWYDNIVSPSIGPIDFYYYQKVVLWSDPSLFAMGCGWRVIDSIQY